MSRRFANSLRRSVASCAIAGLLAGCALSAAPVDHYYRLRIGPVDRSFESPPIPGTLQIRRPRADALTDGANLIYRRSLDPSEVHRDAYQYWTDAPSLILRDVLIDALHSAKAAELIVPPGLRSNADFTLSSRIVKMERMLSIGTERVSLDLEFSLERERDRKLLLHQRYAEEETVLGTGAAAAVAAYDRAIARILDRLLSDLEGALPVETAGLAAWPR